jgi:hypothetical protein
MFHVLQIYDYTMNIKTYVGEQREKEKPSKRMTKVELNIVNLV